MIWNDGFDYYRCLSACLDQQQKNPPSKLASNPEYSLWKCFWQQQQEPFGTGTLSNIGSVLAVSLAPLHRPSAKCAALVLDVRTGTQLHSVALGRCLSCAFVDRSHLLCSWFLLLSNTFDVNSIILHHPHTINSTRQVNSNMTRPIAYPSTPRPILSSEHGGLHQRPLGVSASLSKRLRLRLPHAGLGGRHRGDEVGVPNPERCPMAPTAVSKRWIPTAVRSCPFRCFCSKSL